MSFTFSLLVNKRGPKGKKSCVLSYFLYIINFRVNGWLNIKSVIGFLTQPCFLESCCLLSVFEQTLVQMESTAFPGSQCLRVLSHECNKHAALSLASSPAELPHTVGPSEFCAHGAQQMPCTGCTGREWQTHMSGMSHLLTLRLLCPTVLALPNTNPKVQLLRILR